jgi:hypothetical protein
MHVASQRIHDKIFYMVCYAADGTLACNRPDVNTPRRSAARLAYQLLGGRTCLAACRFTGGACSRRETSLIGEG